MVIEAEDVMDLGEVADRQGWTIQSARVMYHRANKRREAGLVLRPSDLPEPFRVISGRSPIWRRDDIVEWEARRAKSEKRCKQCGDLVVSPLPAGAGYRFECAACAGLEHEE